MSCLLTLPVLRNAISSPVSASGVTPFAAPVGPTLARSGQDHAPANLSARQAREKGLLTSGIYGPRSTISFASAALQSFLESRLQAVTASLGSTLYKLTWKQRATPAGRLIPALRASVLRTSGRDFTGALGGWPTPTATDAARGNGTIRPHDTGIPLPQSNTGGLGDAQCAGLEGHAGHGDRKAGWPEQARPASEAGGTCGMENPCGNGRQAGRKHNPRDDRGQPAATGEICGGLPDNGFWRAADWLFCRDGRWRPVEPGTFPLASGAAARVGRLRGYGNALNAAQAQAFIEAAMPFLVTGGRHA